MSEMSRTARRAMRAKIHRLTSAQSGKVDASDYGPEEVLDAGVKTGMRPVSRRAFKKGGKVVANEGKDAVKHAGKKPRNGSKHLTVDALVNRNLKDANESREGIKHIGGLKTGGRAQRAKGGSTWGESTPLRLVKTHKGPNGHVAKVYKDQDWGEYRVKHYSPEGKHLEKADYHTDDRDEANDSAAYAVEKGFKKGGRAKKNTGGPLDAMGGDLYGLKSAPVTSRAARAAGLKKGGRAEKNNGGGFRLDAPKSGAARIDTTTPEFKAAAAKAAAARAAATGNASTQSPEYRARLGTDKQIVDRGNRDPYEPMPRKSGGKAWEGSAKDEAQDKKLAKKHGMSMKKWEASALDKKHDKQHSTKGLKSGGMAMDGEYQGTRPTGGRIAKRDGGSLAGLEMNTGGRAKKNAKTNINIIIGTGQKQPMAPAPGLPQPPSGGIPVPVPPQGAGAPPMGGAPAPMPMPAAPPPMAAPPMGGAPMPRKRGGRTYRSYKDMDAGAGSGLGRLEKTEIQKHKK